LSTIKEQLKMEIDWIDQKVKECSYVMFRLIYCNLKCFEIYDRRYP
jgi:hypothetical protein